MFRQYSKTTALTARLILLIFLLEYVQPVFSLFEVSEAYAAEYICAQDQNGDGSVDVAGETAVCIDTAQGQLCPIGAVACTRETGNGSSSCPNGSTLNQQTSKCEAPIACSEASLYNNVTNTCEISVSSRAVCSINNQNYPSLSECSAACSSTALCNPTALPISISTENDPATVYRSQNRSTIVGSGNSLKFYQEYVLVVIPLTLLRATVTVPGATFSGRITSIDSGSELTVTPNQICRGQDCINASGVTMSGALWSGDAISYSRYMSIDPDYALVTNSDTQQRHQLYFNQMTCPLLGGSSCAGAQAQCSVQGACADTQCPGGFTLTNGVCTSGNVCSAGFTLNSATDLCEKALNCTGTCNLTQITTTQYQCPADSAVYTDSSICAAHCAQACTQQNTDTTKYQCTSTSSLFDSQPLCESACSVGAVCQTGDICPLGSQYTCMDISGIKQCSPNTCVDISTSIAEITEVDDTMLQDDGPRDSDRTCLGQIYIFTGRGMRCRPPGLQVGLLNDCCESDQPAMSDSVGTLSDVATAISTISKVYELAQVAYYTNAIVTTGLAPTGLATASTSVQAATYAGVMEGSVEAGLQSYASALFNPTTIAISIVVMVVMKLLMGSGCDQKDIETALLRDSEMCHFVGKYCAKSWPIIGCVQRAKGFCCYNSKMARIIHEQGRPQLMAFQPNGAWGSSNRPNCRGFVPEEFQQLDFSKIDLSEYFGDIQTRAQNIIQQNATEKINQYYQNIR